ncbi:MAG: hypothetical protein KDB46_01600 [Solirubrobacterales bacterium]|nr:hypothetical protein [Solirubrobacterales bacterium]
MKPWELARTKEPLAGEAGLDALAREQSACGDWVRVMCANPKLIERPVVISSDGRARLGRPPESVGALLD